MNEICKIPFLSRKLFLAKSRLFSFANHGWQAQGCLSHYLGTFWISEIQGKEGRGQLRSRRGELSLRELSNLRPGVHGVRERPQLGHLCPWPPLRPSDTSHYSWEACRRRQADSGERSQAGGPVGGGVWLRGGPPVGSSPACLCPVPVPRSPPPQQVGWCHTLQEAFPNPSLGCQGRPAPGSTLGTAPAPSSVSARIHLSERAELRVPRTSHDARLTAHTLYLVLVMCAERRARTSWGVGQLKV